MHTASRHPGRRAAALALSLLTTATATALAAAPSTAFTVTGAVATPMTYGPASLAALPAVTQTVNFASGAGAQTHTYTGTSLWGVLGASTIAVDPGVKNDILSRYVLATASDGYQVVFSAGELHPNFGNRPDLLAYTEVVDGVSTPLGANGFALVTVPGDVRGGRYVSSLVNLDVRRAGSTQASPGGGPASQFSVSGAVSSTRSFDLAALQALPMRTAVVGGVSYSGVSFWDLLNTTVGISLNAAVKNDVLGKYVVATASDGYRSVFSLGELNPSFGNQPDLIAFAADGAGLGANGFARLVVPNDVRQGRWVSNLVSLDVFSASPVPEPSHAAMLLAGLLAFTALGLGRAKARPVAHESRQG